MPFVGGRLREAREARDLTATSLAELLDVSKQYVSKWERGAEPPSAMVQRISAELKMPQHFFFRPVEPHEETRMLFWRSTSPATKRARTRELRRFVWLRTVTRYLSRFVEFPAVDFPSIDMPADDPAKISVDSIETAATTIRRHWGLGDGPISNVSWLLENKGVVVARHDFDFEHLDAFSEWHPSRHPYIVLASDKGSACRSRFDAAHELGHLLLHRQVPERLFNNKAVHAQMEHQANQFASAFLLPVQTFSTAFYSTSIDALIPMKSQWQVSIGAMISRAAHLGLISEHEERRMWINLSRKGWRKREPLDEEIAPEQPRFLRRALDIVVSNGLAAPNELPIHLGLSFRTIEDVLGLEEGYLSGLDRDLPVRDDAPRIVPFPGLSA